MAGEKMDEKDEERTETVVCKLCGREIDYDAAAGPPVHARCPDCGYEMTGDDLLGLV